MCSDNHSSFFEKCLETPDDGLCIEVTIEPLIEASLEVEEEQHQFTGALSMCLIDSRLTPQR